ncbi:AEL234Cp [Eremothecium gossypii ATCC 10895]|uniref:AEL234Cp n=1 Tax=Eremothecium gossypii (strain ATCC 10895 / CBS 109.51 / FGSC 9923 / NRRL Y-1056) TaxID=284811 RepID=Q758J6_EREGS|nr:AEL234Cp [Eremothecium gossypii ATCC 10895]AAS52451.2 AEL234Cp [Eremothecium gossypii ATCC 10895]
MAEKEKKGLATEIHPALRSSNLNLLRSKRENPYLSSDAPRQRQPKRRQPLAFYKPGEISQRAEEERQRRARELEEQQLLLRKQEEEEHIRREKIAAAELPDDDETCYFDAISALPSIEWWDTKFCDGSQPAAHAKYTASYADLEDDSDCSDDEQEDERPSIRFVKHPLPFQPSVTAAATIVPKIYLTKHEQRKVRRNQRKTARQMAEERIRLGLEPRPPPKVRLNNMMHVYDSNTKIQDPTAWEHTVREQIEQRRQQHLRTNEERRLEARAQRAAQPAPAPDPGQDICRVYSLPPLADPKARYKLVTNARQLHLRGCCLHVPDGPALVVAIGPPRACTFYDRLLTRRLAWHASAPALLWTGAAAGHTFRGWFMKQCAEPADLRRILLAAGGPLFAHTPLPS